MVPEIWNVTDNFLLFWTIFCSFTLLTTWKKKIFQKKWKKNNWRYHHFTQKSWSHCYTVPEIQGVTAVIFVFHFGLFILPFYHPPPPPKQQPKKSKFLKNKKTPEISPFYTSVPKIRITWYTVAETWCTMDGQTVRQT